MNWSCRRYWLSSLWTPPPVPSAHWSPLLSTELWMLPRFYLLLTCWHFPTLLDETVPNSSGVALTQPYWVIIVTSMLHFVSCCTQTFDDTVSSVWAEAAATCTLTRNGFQLFYLQWTWGLENWVLLAQVQAAISRALWDYVETTKEVWEPDLQAVTEKAS